MPTITSALSPSSGGVTLNAGGGGGGVIGPTSTAPTGTISYGTSYFSPAPAPVATSYGSGSAGSIAAAAAGMFDVSGNAFYDKRLAEIYYLGDKPWYDETRFDEFGFEQSQSGGSLKGLLILAALLLLTK